jgi:hypothetical protein
MNEPHLIAKAASNSVAEVGHHGDCLSRIEVAQLKKNI